VDYYCIICIHLSIPSYKNGESPPCTTEKSCTVSPSPDSEDIVSLGQRQCRRWLNITQYSIRLHLVCLRVDCTRTRRRSGNSPFRRGTVSNSPLILGMAVLCFMSRLEISRHFLTALARLPRLYDCMIPVNMPIQRDSSTSNLPVASLTHIDGYLTDEVEGVEGSCCWLSTPHRATNYRLHSRDRGICITHLQAASIALSLSVWSKCSA
jgi:hypothetical protein